MTTIVSSKDASTVLLAGLKSIVENDDQQKSRIESLIAKNLEIKMANDRLKRDIEETKEKLRTAERLNAKMHEYLGCAARRLVSRERKLQEATLESLTQVNEFVDIIDTVAEKENAGARCPVCHLRSESVKELAKHLSREQDRMHKKFVRRVKGGEM